MFADRVYDQDFFAAMADRGFYVFTSSPQSCGGGAHDAAPSGTASSEWRQAVADSSPAASVLAEAA